MTETRTSHPLTVEEADRFKGHDLSGFDTPRPEGQPIQAAGSSVVVTP